MLSLSNYRFLQLLDWLYSLETSCAAKLLKLLRGYFIWGVIKKGKMSTELSEPPLLVFGSLFFFFFLFSFSYCAE